MRAVAGGRAGVPLLAGVAGAAVTAMGIGVPAPWRDEQATAAVASRTWPQLIELVTGPTDAVHAAYYALLHGWVAVGGIDPLWLRLPSALAIGLAAAGVMVFGRQVDSERTGLIAVAVFLTVPRVFWAGGEARSYALQIAAAVWLMVLFVEAVRRGRWWRWVLFAVATAAADWVFLYLALLGVAQVAALLIVPGWRRRLLPALAALAAGTAAALPVVVLGYAQRSQISWVRRPDAGIVGEVAKDQWFMGSTLYAALAGVLVAAGVVAIVARPPVRHATPRQLLALLLPWLLLPTAIVVIFSFVATPVYVDRYLVLSTPAVALLAALALARLPWFGLVPALAVLVAVTLPAAIQSRQPDAKGDWGEVAAAIAATGGGAQGAALYFSSDADGDEPRGIATFYPDAVAGFDDVAWVESAVEAGTLHDVVAPAGEVVGRLDDGQALFTVLQTGSLPAEAARVTFEAAGLVEVVLFDSGETRVSRWGRG